MGIVVSFTYNGGQSTSGVNFYHNRLDLYEKKAMRENHTNVCSNLYLSLGHFDQFWYPDLMTYVIKVRWKESIQTCLKLGEEERKIHTVNRNIYNRRVVLSLGDNRIKCIVLSKN